MRGRGPRWTGPRSSAINRDRRDQAFARSVIAAAAKLNQEAVAREAVAASEPDRCAYCSREPVDAAYDPYCSS